MPQLFSPSANSAAVMLLVGAVLLAGGAAAGMYVLYRSPTVTGEGLVHLQPVPFSHEYHVGRMGFDCRYCHAAVEHSPFAGMPSTKTCMNCHRQILAQAELLEPVRRSYNTDRPLVWQRVNNMADFVYFDHSIHVRKGFGCSECHGRVDQMHVVWQVQPLTMQWCLDCHRNPQRYVRPVDEVFDAAWTPPPDSRAMRARLAEEYGLRRLTSCSVCHR